MISIFCLDLLLLDAIGRFLFTSMLFSSTGPDDIPPKHTKLTESSITTSLTSLLSYSARLKETTDWAKARLLVHLTATWKSAIDDNLVVTVALVVFRKAFYCVQHATLLQKLKFPLATMVGRQLIDRNHMIDYVIARSCDSKKRSYHQDNDIVG